MKSKYLMVRFSVLVLISFLSINAFAKCKCAHPQSNIIPPTRGLDISNAPPVSVDNGGFGPGLSDPVQEGSSTPGYHGPNNTFANPYQGPTVP